jgi:hypothetical protein
MRLMKRMRSCGKRDGSCAVDIFSGYARFASWLDSILGGICIVLVSFLSMSLLIGTRVGLLDLGTNDRFPYPPSAFILLFLFGIRDLVLPFWCRKRFSSFGILFTFILEVVHTSPSPSWSLLLTPSPESSRYSLISFHSPAFDQQKGFCL